MPTEPKHCAVRVGPAGWAYDDWAGIVYPPGMPKSRHPLTLISRWFDTVEVNSSFYHMPNPRNGGAWLRHVAENPRFLFTMKLWRGFTHDDPAGDSLKEAAAAFQAAVAPLRVTGRLGMLLAQFPWSFRRTPENRVRLARLADAFSGWPLAVEVRHASWDHPDFYGGLAARGITFCAVDQPLLRDCLKPSPRVTGPLAYARLHGRNSEHWFREGSGRNDRYNYLYTPEQVGEWLERIGEMTKNTRGLFVITNNHYRGQAVANALEIQAGLGLPTPEPPPGLAAAYPRLRETLRR